MNSNSTYRLMHFGLRSTPVLIAILLFASSCNPSEENLAPVENLPELTEALETFDEEVEYLEYYSAGETNARWGFRKWRRKPTFLTLVSALNYTGLLKTVIKGKLTIFAPDDKAFSELGLNFWNIRNRIDKETLTAILLNHVADGFVFSSDLDCSLQTLGKTTLRVIEVDGGLVFQDDTDEAANILFTDKKAFHSIYHGIDKVLLLDMPAGTIADLAIDAASSSTPQFTQLVAALSKAGLVGAVSNPDDDLTVFAPTDEAFDNLYAGLGVSGIEEISVDILTRVLKHHVVGARVFSNCLENGMVPTLNQSITINADEFKITASSGGDPVNIIVSDETVDIKASNGVIHVIDGVLVPANYLDPLM